MQGDRAPPPLCNPPPPPVSLSRSGCVRGSTAAAAAELIECVSADRSKAVRTLRSLWGRVHCAV